MHWQHFKNLFSRTTGAISTKLGAMCLFVKETKIFTNNQLFNSLRGHNVSLHCANVLIDWNCFLGERYYDPCVSCFLFKFNAKYSLRHKIIAKKIFAKKSLDDENKKNLSCFNSFQMELRSRLVSVHVLIRDQIHSVKFTKSNFNLVILERKLCQCLIGITLCSNYSHVK